MSELHQFVATEKHNVMHKFARGKMGTRIDPIAPWEKTPRVATFTPDLYGKCKPVLDKLVEEDKIKEFVSDAAVALKEAVARHESAEKNHTDLKGRIESAQTLLNASKNGVAEAQKVVDTATDIVKVKEDIAKNPPENGKTAANKDLADARRDLRASEKVLKEESGKVADLEEGLDKLNTKFEAAGKELALAESLVE